MHTTDLMQAQAVRQAGRLIVVTALAFAVVS